MEKELARHGRPFAHWLCLHGLLLALAAPLAAADQAAPTLKLPALDGGASLSLEDFRGQVVYVDFWASWCGPCRKSLPLYESLYQELGSRGFAILAVNLDEDPGDARAFLEKHPISYAVVTDPGGATAEAWGLKVMPTSYLIGRDGALLAQFPGFEDSHLEDIRNAIETALAR